MDTFTSLPCEIRVMVYSLLLVDSRPQNIRSPAKRKSSRATWLRKESAACLSKFRLLNKLVHDEASMYYYSYNTFIIGNGLFGSSWEPNSHALKQFVRAVPSAYISRIRSLILNINLLPPLYDYPSYLGPRATFGRHDAAELQAICRTLVKHFTGVETVEIRTESIAQDNIYHRDEYPAPLASKKAMKIVTCLPNLKKILFPKDNDSGDRGDISIFFFEVRKEMKLELLRASGWSFGLLPDSLHVGVKS